MGDGIESAVEPAMGGHLTIGTDDNEGLRHDWLTIYVSGS